MTQAAVIAAKVRRERGSQAARRLRAGGTVPAIIYGHQQESVALAVPLEELEALLRRGAHGLVQLDVEGKLESVVIKEMQWDPFGTRILHVDFARVSGDERLSVDVPIVVRGTAPGIKEGGVFSQTLRSLLLECPATNMQETVVVNVNHLHLAQAILVKDLELKEGVKALVDPEQIVVAVTMPVEEEEAETAAEAPAEPELIRRESKAEGTEE